MLYEYTVDFYELLTGKHYMRCSYNSNVDIVDKEFDQDLVNNVGMVNNWQNSSKFYVVVERMDNLEGWTKRHHFNSVNFKGIVREEKK